MANREDCPLCVSDGNWATCDLCNKRMSPEDIKTKHMCVGCWDLTCDNCFKQNFVQQALSRDSPYQDGDEDSYMCDRCYKSIFAPTLDIKGF